MKIFGADKVPWRVSPLNPLTAGFKMPTTEQEKARWWALHATRRQVFPSAVLDPGKSLDTKPHRW